MAPDKLLGDQTFDHESEGRYLKPPKYMDP